MLEKIRENKFFAKLFNRETILYVIFGAFTTLINILTFSFFYSFLGWHEIASNTVAWVISVLFAYVVNKKFVFESKTDNLKEVLIEAGKFTGARIFSFLVDTAGIWILISVLGFNSSVSKIALNVVVMVMNYFFSKLLIFNKKEKL